MATIKINNVTALTESGGAVTLDSGVVFPAGHVIQTKHFHQDYWMNITSTTSETDIQQSSGVVWEPSITVTSGNKILIFITANLKGNNHLGADGRGSIRLYQKIGSGSYTLLVSNLEGYGGYDYGSSGIWVKVPHSLNYLSSPNSGEEIKYKMTCQNNNTSMTTSVNDASADITHMILQEVQA